MCTVEPTMQTVWQDRLVKNSSTHHGRHDEKKGKIQERGRAQTVAAETLRRQTAARPKTKAKTKEHPTTMKPHSLRPMRTREKVAFGTRSRQGRGAIRTVSDKVASDTEIANGSSSRVDGVNVE